MLCATTTTGETCIFLHEEKRAFFQHTVVLTEQKQYDENGRADGVGDELGGGECGDQETQAH